MHRREWLFFFLDSLTDESSSMFRLLYGTTFPVLMPHVEGLFRTILFPALYLQASDWDTFINEPEEFIRMVYGPHLSFPLQRTSA